MSLINTTHGLLDETELARTVGFEDRPNEFVVWVEWKLGVHEARTCAVCADQANPRPDASGIVLVKRDAHVILKQGSVVADALAASLG